MRSVLPSAWDAARGEKLLRAFAPGARKALMFCASVSRLRVATWRDGGDAATHVIADARVHVSSEVCLLLSVIIPYSHSLY